MYTKFENNPSSGFWVITLTPLRAAGGGWWAAGGGRLRHKTITSPDPSDTGDIIINCLKHGDNLSLHEWWGMSTDSHCYCYRSRMGGGGGVISQFPLFHYFLNFSVSPKYTLAIENHVHIWQVSLQLRCSDTCQIWMWHKESNRYFWQIKYFVYDKVNKLSSSNPQPRSPVMQLSLCNALEDWTPCIIRWCFNSLRPSDAYIRQ